MSQSVGALTESNRDRALVVKMFDGYQDYTPVWEAMQAYTDSRNNEDSDQIWLLQHQPVFTQGQAGKAEHLLSTGDIPVVQVDRGGQVTYHGPGQLVAYVLFDIERMSIGARQLVTGIENAIVNTLKVYDIESAPKADAPGVYVGDAKIASLGLRIRKGKSFHGLSLNIDMDMEPFQRINPCGYAGMEMAQLSDYEQCEPIESVSGRLVSALKDSFGYREIILEYCEHL